MPTFEITGPDGKVYEVTGPEGSTPEQALARVRSGAVASKTKTTPSPTDTFDPTEGMSTFEKTAAGVGSGLTDLWGGIKGFAARHGVGDPIAEAAAQAEKAKYDKALTDTTAGGIGHFVGEVAPTLLPGMGVLKGASMLPKGLQLLGGIAGNTALGAAQGATAPTADPNANDAERAVMGGLWGAGGDVVGRGVGRLVRPLKDAVSPYAQQAVDTIKHGLGDKARLLATNLSDNPLIKGATDALAKVPIFGAGVNSAREANLSALTEANTAPTGTTMDKLLPQDVSAMWRQLEAKANQFRSGPSVPMAPVAAEATAAADRVKAYAAATSQGGDVSKLQAAAKAAENPPSGLVTAAGVPFPPAPKFLPANDVMDLRRAASEMAHKETDPVLAAQYRAYRESLDDALKSTLPQPQIPGQSATEHPFDVWRKQWGAAENVRKAADAGLSPQGHLLPQNLEKNVSERVRGGSLSNDPLENLNVAAKARLQQPPGGENRALLTAMMFGLPVAGAAVGKYTDSPVTGTAAALSPFLASLLLGSRGGGRYMSGTIPGQEAASRLAQLLAQQGVSAGVSQ